MRATIDSAKCMGHGMCYSLAPNVFTEDDQGYGHVIGEGIEEDEVPPALAEEARNGAANCPESAISVTE
jgi:ferredoxin